LSDGENALAVVVVTFFVAHFCQKAQIIRFLCDLTTTRRVAAIGAVSIQDEGRRRKARRLLLDDF
jgi:hypothetical protein